VTHEMKRLIPIVALILVVGVAFAIMACLGPTASSPIATTQGTTSSVIVLESKPSTETAHWTT